MVSVLLTIPVLSFTWLVTHSVLFTTRPQIFLTRHLDQLDIQRSTLAGKEIRFGGFVIFEEGKRTQ